MDDERKTRSELMEEVARLRTRVSELELWLDGKPFEDAVRPTHGGTQRTATREALRKSEEQLRQSQKMESIGRLAGGVAHDFNNLLTVINGYATFVFDDLRAGDPMKDDLQQIVDAGDRATTLTRQLLAFSRKQITEPRILDLNEVVRQLEKMLRRVIGEDISLRTVLADGLGPINADPGLMEQVLMNLAVNAREAMPQGGELTIETANVVLDGRSASGPPGTAAGAYVRLAVTDSGHGLATEVRERIFEPFFTTRDRGEGSGLGLTAVHDIVEQSGGHIQANSVPGRGTTFEVYLPRGDTRAVDEPRQGRADSLRGTETILIVEDESAVRNLTKRLLTSAGYRVVTAAGGEEALVACERHGDEIQLVLTDVIMPLMSGKELAEQITRICPNLKVLFMSGYADDTLGRHGVLEMPTHFISKPFNARALLEKVRAALTLD